MVDDSLNAELSHKCSARKTLMRILANSREILVDRLGNHADLEKEKTRGKHQYHNAPRGNCSGLYQNV